jgi:RNA polymerase sigma factor (sigma-70 family)
MVHTTTGLIERIAAGEAEAFGPLYRRLAPSLYVWVSLRVLPEIRHRLDPEDIVQEVWYRVCDKLETFDPRIGAFRSWVFGIANNLLRDELRKLRRRSRIAEVLENRETRNIVEGLADEATSVTRQVSRNEQIQELLEKSRGLGDLDRRLLLFRGLEGLTFAEVANRLDLDQDAVESRWRRLRARLRVHLLPRGLLED